MDAVTEIGGKPVENFTPGAGDGDGCALRMQDARDAAADRAGGSRDQRGLAGKFKHSSPRERVKLTVRSLEPGDVFGRADRRSVGRFGDALNQAGEHFAGADFIEHSHTRLHHEQNRFAPANRAGHLLDQTAYD